MTINEAVQLIEKAAINPREASTRADLGFGHLSERQRRIWDWQYSPIGVQFDRLSLLPYPDPSIRPTAFSQDDKAGKWWQKNNDKTHDSKRGSTTHRKSSDQPA